MRKLEAAMVASIKLGRDFDSENTRVSVNDNEAWVYLHGNHIATVDRKTGEVEVNRDTFRKWPTQVTRSRLKALGVNVYIKKGIAYIGNEEL